MAKSAAKSAVRSVVKGCVAAAAVVATLAAPAVAGQEHLDIIYEQCGIQLNQSAAVCGCMADGASARLNDNQQAFMAAQVTANGPEIARTQALLDQTQAMQVMEFMTTVIGACGG